MKARNWLVVATALLALGTTTTRGAAQKAATTGPSDDAVRFLRLVAAEGSPTTLALLLSGDGGWAAIDRRIAEVLSTRGVTVVASTPARIS
jgi:type IV secretory pathway VirJ component